MKNKQKCFIWGIKSDGFA